MQTKIIEIFEKAVPRDKILNYLKSSRRNDMVLEESELRYVEQLDYVDNLLRNNRELYQADYIRMIMEKFCVSRSTARNLILDAQFIHGSMSKQVKAYEKEIMTKYLWGRIKVWEEEKKDKFIVAALDLIARINGLDKPDDATNEEESQNVIIRPAFIPETLGVPLPENIDELIENLRRRIKFSKAIQNALTE